MRVQPAQQLWNLPCIGVKGPPSLGPSVLCPRCLLSRVRRVHTGKLGETKKVVIGYGGRTCGNGMAVEQQDTSSAKGRKMSVPQIYGNSLSTSSAGSPTPSLTAALGPTFTCEECDRPTQFAGVSRAVRLLGISRSTVYYWMDRRWIHWRVLPSGRRVICLGSLSSSGNTTPAKPGQSNATRRSRGVRALTAVASE